MEQIQEKIKAIEKRLKEINAKEIEVLRRTKNYFDSNRIYFFNTESLPANPIQAELLEAWDNSYYKVFTYTGANRIGKTTILAIVAFSTMFGKWPWSGKKLHFPHANPRKIRIVGQDWENHIKTVLMPRLKEWWPNDRARVSDITKKNNVGVEALWTDPESGSTIEIMSNKQETDSFEGWDGDLVCYDEPPKREIRVACARGLIDRLGRELFCMTLLKEAWVDREVIKARLKDGSVDDTVFNVNGDINVNIGYGITQEGVDQFASKITDEEKEARLHGKPSYMSGMVYPTFSRKIYPQGHICDRFKIPTDWIVDVAIDIHPREKQAALFTATNPQNFKYVTDEIWDHGDPEWLADEIIRVITSNAYRIGKIVIDPFSKGDRNNPSTVYDKIDNKLFAHGLELFTATKDKLAGIHAVRRHLKGPNNMPSLVFFKDLVRTIWEIEGYMFKEGSPIDKDDHMMENLYRTLLLDTKWTEPLVTKRVMENKPNDWMGA